QHSEEIASRSFFAALERRLSKQAFQTWFRPLRVTRSPAEGVLRIAVPNPAVRDWILSQYSTVLRESLLEVKLEGCRIEWATPQGERVGPAIDVTVEPSISALTRVAINAIAGAGAIEERQLPDIPSAPLNEKYTFGSFVVAS